jgi:hypothetical protein
MKALMIFGALVGFVIGSSSGLAGRSSWETALWRATACALVAAVLTRWWARVWFDGLKESLNQRRQAGRSLAPNPKSTVKP